MTGSGPTRIALVGAGRMGQVHLAALERSEEIAVGGVVEPVAAIREQLEAAGVTVYGSVRELLESASLDAVLIAAPTDQHPDLVETFAGARIPMLCEKPVGVPPPGRRTCDPCGCRCGGAAAGRLLAPVRAGAARAARTDRRRRAGDISLLSCMQWDAGLPSEEFRAHAGGIVVDMGVHEIDQAAGCWAPSSSRSRQRRQGRARSHARRRTPTPPSCWRQRPPVPR